MAGTLSEFGKIKMPNTDVHYLKDTDARKDIEKIKEILATGVTYAGVTLTPLKDGSTDAQVTIRNKDGSTKVVTAKAGTTVFYNGMFFAYNGDVWDQLGSLSELKALAYKDTASATYTPQGSLTQPIFRGKEGNISVKGTPTGSVTAPEFTGSKGTITVNGTAKGSVSVSTDNATPQNANYVPSGTVSVSANTKSIDHITGVGTLPQVTTVYSDGDLRLTFNPGTLPTKEPVTVADGIKSASFAGDGTTIKAAFTGANNTSTGEYTPAGSVSAPTFRGNELTSTGKTTPSGSVTTPTFVGTEATIISS